MRDGGLDLPVSGSQAHIPQTGSSDPGRCRHAPHTAIGSDSPMSRGNRLPANGAPCLCPSSRWRRPLARSIAGYGSNPRSRWSDEPVQPAWAVRATTDEGAPPPSNEAVRRRWHRRCRCQQSFPVPAARSGKDAVGRSVRSGGGGCRRAQLSAQRVMDIRFAAAVCPAVPQVQRLSAGGARGKRHGGLDHGWPGPVLPVRESVRYRDRLGRELHGEHDMDLGWQDICSSSSLVSWWWCHSC